MHHSCNEAQEQVNIKCGLEVATVWKYCRVHEFQVTFYYVGKKQDSRYCYYIWELKHCSLLWLNKTVSLSIDLPYQKTNLHHFHGKEKISAFLNTLRVVFVSSSPPTASLFITDAWLPTKTILLWFESHCFTSWTSAVLWSLAKHTFCGFQKC